MSYQDWHVGMKVVCIDGAKRLFRSDWEKFPIAGQIYTIRSIVLDDEAGRVGIRLVEIENAQNERRKADSTGSREVGFTACRFRPVQHRKTSIEVFTRMLTDTKQKVPAI